MNKHLKSKEKKILIPNAICGVLGIIVMIHIVFVVLDQRVWAVEALSSNPNLAETISSTIESERANLENLNQRLARMKETGKSLAAELNVYKIQNTALGNLTLQPQVRLGDLENALGQIQITIDNLDNRVKEIKERQKNINSLRKQNVNQL
ncbi:MAG: hypothetical protein PVI90_19670, partial [Desulfobacteraceae bacterium]